MALLTRHLKLSDHDDTQIFTFVGTKSVTRDLSRDITSKDFRQENYKLNFYIFKKMTIKKNLRRHGTLARRLVNTNKIFQKKLTNLNLVNLGFEDVSEHYTLWLDKIINALLNFGTWTILLLRAPHSC